MITACAFVLLAAIGAVIRVWLREWSARTWTFPVGTVVANLAGCFALGLLSAWSAPAATVVGTAGLGALTTYSTFTADLADLGRNRPVAAIAYLAVSVGGGVGLAYVGLRLA